MANKSKVSNRPKPIEFDVEKPKVPEASKPTRFIDNIFVTNN